MQPELLYPRRSRFAPIYYLKERNYDLNFKHIKSICQEYTYLN
jgi:hypothetical protein